jgi:4-amino-4-deoxy-L-arabinose transferase-like glycosyltransferase
MSALGDAVLRGLARARSSGAAAPLLGALVVRLFWIALCPNVPMSDSEIYHDGARSILNGAGFAYAAGDPIGFWPVGYSAALAVVYALFGVKLGAATAFNLLAGLLTVYATYALGRELYDRRVGVLAAWAIALYPSFIVYPTVLASENLYIPLWICAVWLAVRAQRSPRGTLVIAACGLVSGVATLVRPTAFVFPMVVVAAALLFGRGNLAALAAKHTVIVCALVIGMSFPWALRNQRVFGEFSFTPFNGGVVLWVGNHPGADGQNVMEGEVYANFDSAEAVKLPLPERDRRHARAAIDFIKKNPLEFAKLVVLRAFHTMKNETIAIAWNYLGVRKSLGESAVLPLKIVTSVGYGLLMVAAAAAFVRMLQRRSAGRRELYLLVATLAASIPFLVVLAMDRYHFPLIPLVAVFAAAFFAPRASAEPAAAGRGTP